MPLWALPLCRLAAGAAPVTWPWASAAPCGLAVDGRPWKPSGEVKVCLEILRTEPLGEVESSLVDARNLEPLGEAKSSLVDARD
ncbi:hypothetical protein BHM03_00056281 [Ensete ventricosum]|nr:hypothetical protein BHM03_00056281 [Ensete ventricosum]